jgi:tape measure domain-containing protein
MAINNEVKYTISLKDLFTSAIRKAKGETDDLDKSVNKVQGSANALGGTMSRIFAGVSAGLFAKSIYDVGTSFEDAQMGLKTLLKTEEAANDVFNSIMEDAQKTPFDFKSLLMANKALLGAGDNAENARKVVLDLANAIAASGGGSDELSRMVVNLQQIKNTGKASALDIKQFAFAGINIYGALANATGLPIEKVRELDVTYEQLSNALEKARASGGMFENGLENAMNTVSGATSNLGDKFDLLKFKLFNIAKDGLNSALNGLAAFIEKIEQVVRWNKENIAGIIEFTRNLVEGMMPALKIVGGALQIAFSITSGLIRGWNKLGILGQSLLAFASGFVIALKAIQVAQSVYNATLAITAALSGNWAGLAVAGIIAAAGATWFLVDAANEYNKKKNEGLKIKGKKPTLAVAAKEGASIKNAAAVSAAPTASATPAAKAEAPKYTQINISVNKMQASENIYIESGVKQSENQIANKVLEMLTGALNDSQRMAGVH